MRFFGAWCLVGVATGVAAAEPDPALAADRGQMRTWFAPMTAEASGPGRFAIAVDARGRIVAGNGDLSIYDGATIERLPRPGGAFTSALALDAQERIWTGNTAELGCYTRGADGAWTFRSVRGDLAPEHRGYEDLWSVHCVGGSVVFVATQQAMRWRDGRFEVWRWPTAPRLTARTEGDGVLIIQLGATAGEPARIWSIGGEGEPRLLPFRGGPTRPTVVFAAGDRWVLGGRDSDSSAFWFDAAGNLIDDVPHPAWKLRPAAPIATPEGWVFGCSGGMMSMRYDGRLRFALSARTATVPSSLSDVMAAAPDGRMWTINAFGLLGIEPSGRTTYFGAEQGIVNPIVAINRVGQELWLAGSRGLVLFAPAANPPAVGRMTPGEDLPGLGTNSIAGAQGIEVVAGRFALVAGETFAVMSLADQQWTVALGGAPVRARTFTQPWPETDSEMLLGSTEREVLLFGIEPGVWPVKWRKAFPRIDRVWPLPGRRALLADPDGRVWVLQWTRTTAGTWEFAEAPRLLTPPAGLGRIVRVDLHGDEAWAYAHDEAWVWRGGDAAFRSLASDAPPGLTLVAVARDGQGREWALGRAPSLVSDAPGNPVYAIWRVRTAPGRVEGLGAPPVEAIERVGVLSNAFLEPAAPGDQGSVWWLAGTYGIARVSLERATRPLAFVGAPYLESVRDGAGGRLSLAEEPRLHGERSMEVRFGFAQTAHWLPVAYQTKLEGLDADWSPPSLERRRRWERLPGGAFTFRVRAVDAVGQVSPDLKWPVHVELRLTETRWFWVTVAAGAAFGAWGGAWGWTRRLRRRQAQLERAIGERTEALLLTNQELRRQSERRTELVGVITHELRTPLIGAAFLAQRAGAQIPAGPARDDVAQLGAQIENLRHLLDGNLDLSRFELGLIPVRWEVKKWGPVVGEIAATHAAAAAAKGLAWTFRTEGGGERWAFIDTANHRRAAHNLLSNAVKYTSGGSIETVVRWRPAVVAGANVAAAATTALAWIEWEIVDTGPGLPSGVLASLDGFFRRHEIERDGAGEGGGNPSAGLGLALVVRLVRLAGGTLTAENRAEGGACFRLRLPAIDLGADPAMDPLDYAPPFPWRILIVEDEAPQRAHLADLLEPLGGMLDLAASCEEAAKLAAARRHDLALLDFNLPDGTGLELLRRLQADGTCPRLVAMVSAHESEPIRAACLAAGCAAFLAKPLSIRAAVELLMRVGADGSGGAR